MLSGGLTACGPAAPPPVIRQTPAPQPGVPQNNVPSGGNSGLRQRQAEFLHRIRQADPQFKTIDRALLNEQNELGLVLNQSVAMDDIPALMRTMLAQMAKAFPQQDLTVVAYAPSNPPMKIGTATLDARSGDMKYVRAQP